MTIALNELQRILYCVVCIGSEGIRVKVIPCCTVTLLFSLLLCRNLFTNVQHMYLFCYSIKQVLDVRGTMLPLKLLVNLLAKKTSGNLWTRSLRSFIVVLKAVRKRYFVLESSFCIAWTFLCACSLKSKYSLILRVLFSFMLSTDSLCRSINILLNHWEIIIYFGLALKQNLNSF